MLYLWIYQEAAPNGVNMYRQQAETYQYSYSNRIKQTLTGGNIVRSLSHTYDQRYWNHSLTGKHITEICWIKHGFSIDW